jgi:adenylate cyclase
VLTKSFAAWLYQFRGESGQTLQCAQQGLSIAEDNGFAFWVGWGRILEYWARDVEGKEIQVSAMQEGLDIWCATGSELGSSYFLFLLGERYLAHDDLPMAWQCLDRAKEFIAKTGENWWQAEICRLEGLLHLAATDADPEKAELCFRNALKIAAGQKAKCLELRAATSLARLLTDTPRRAEGFEILNELVNWFQEGLELPDMLQARAILKEASKIPGHKVPYN